MSLVKLNARSATALDATVLTGSPIIQQIVTQTTDVTNCTSTSFIDLNGMTGSITPLSASSTILFTISGVVNIDNNRHKH